MNTVFTAFWWEIPFGNWRFSVGCPCQHTRFYVNNNTIVGIYFYQSMPAGVYSIECGGVYTIITRSSVSSVGLSALSKRPLSCRLSASIKSANNNNRRPIQRSRWEDVRKALPFNQRNSARNNEVGKRVREDERNLPLIAVTYKKRNDPINWSDSVVLLDTCPRPYPFYIL